jgi:hypothetical protein
MNLSIKLRHRQTRDTRMPLVWRVNAPLALATCVAADF